VVTNSLSESVRGGEIGVREDTMRNEKGRKGFGVFGSSERTSRVKERCKSISPYNANN